MGSVIAYDYNQVLHALGNIYVSLYLFDLKSNTLEAIKSNSFIDKWAAEAEGAQEKTNNVMRNITFPEHLEAIMEFVDLSTLDARLEDEDNVSMVFKGKVNGWCRARFVVLSRAEDGTVGQVIYAVESINREKERENRLLYVSQTDLMTGILNRGTGEAKIAALLSEGEEGLFGLFDIDQFKQVNDTYGHAMGDKVLIAVADCMKKVFRSSDVIMRLGGDEFAFFAPGATASETAMAIAERLFHEIERISIDALRENVVVSLGLTFCAEGDTFDAVYKRADDAVYASKHNKGCSLKLG